MFGNIIRSVISDFRGVLVLLSYMYFIRFFYVGFVKMLFDSVRSSLCHIYMVAHDSFNLLSSHYM